MQQVEVLCTTDDPADDLKYHSLLAEDSSLGFSVLPTFRPGRILDIEAPGFAEYAFRLGDIAGTDISTLEGLLHALEKRLDFLYQKDAASLITAWKQIFSSQKPRLRRLISSIKKR